MDSHGIDVCRCGTVIAQCRCMEHTERRVVCQSCATCRRPERDGIARRARVDCFTPAELAIYEAMGDVEALPADVRLTDAVALLQRARDSVADYVDDVPRREPEGR